MSEHDLTKTLIEQLQPIMVAMRGRIEADLSDRDKAVMIDALVDAAVAGIRIGIERVSGPTGGRTRLESRPVTIH